MRMLVKFTCPIEPFNSYIKDGSAPARMQKLMEAIKPEAAYFTSMKGARGGILIVNMDKASDMPRLCEPLFLTLNASVKVMPCMVMEDLAQADLAAIGKAWS